MVQSTILFNYVQQLALQVEEESELKFHTSLFHFHVISTYPVSVTHARWQVRFLTMTFSKSKLPFNETLNLEMREIHSDDWFH